MPHIHSLPGQHDQTASAFIVRTDQNEPKLLLHRHRVLAKYLQFGGHIELNETPWQTIIRELKEESGYELSQLKILQPKLRLKKLVGAKLHPVPLSVDTHTFSPDVPGHFHTDMKYLFISSEPPKRRPDSRESADFRLLNKRELAELNDDQIFADVRVIGSYIFDSVLSAWEAVDPRAIYNLVKSC